MGTTRCGGRAREGGRVGVCSEARRERGSSTAAAAEVVRQEQGGGLPKNICDIVYIFWRGGVLCLVCPAWWRLAIRRARGVWLAAAGCRCVDQWWWCRPTVQEREERGSSTAAAAEVVRQEQGGGLLTMETISYVCVVRGSTVLVVGGGARCVQRG